LIEALPDKAQIQIKCPHAKIHVDDDCEVMKEKSIYPGMGPGDGAIDAMRGLGPND